MRTCISLMSRIPFLMGHTLFFPLHCLLLFPSSSFFSSSHSSSSSSSSPPPSFVFLPQDLLRFTHTTHPDKIHLQMALARFEGIADYLNEAKRQVEQRSIVEHLNNKVTGLPFKLVDSKRWLHRQDVVTRLVSCL